jgi:hypothetical protein
VLNATSLFTSLSFFGLPNLQYSSQWAFFFCLVCLLIQYALFVRFYVTKRRAFAYWRMRDCIFVRSVFFSRLGSSAASNTMLFAL